MAMSSHSVIMFKGKNTALSHINMPLGSRSSVLVSPVVLSSFKKMYNHHTIRYFKVRHF